MSDCIGQQIITTSEFGIRSNYKTDDPLAWVNQSRKHHILVKDTWIQLSTGLVGHIFCHPDSNSKPRAVLPFSREVECTPTMQEGCHGFDFSCVSRIQRFNSRLRSRVDDVGDKKSANLNEVSM
jgi:hypothetical protein